MANQKVSRRENSGGKKRPASRQGNEVPVSAGIERAAERAGLQAARARFTMTDVREKARELIEWCATATDEVIDSHTLAQEDWRMTSFRAALGEIRNIKIALSNLDEAAERAIGAADRGAS